jgi:hypothetical protein
MTWAEFREIVAEWIRYGDDPFADEMGEVAYALENCKDPEYAAILREVYKTMEMLQEYGPRLR